MDVRFLNPFLESAREVLKAEANLIIEKGTLTLDKTSLTTDELTILVSMVGEVQGVVFYGMSIQTGLNLVSRMLDQTFSELDDLARSGVAELGNVITGRASIKLSENGINCNISTPTVIEGKDVKISTLDFARVIVPMQIEAGLIMVHLALRISKPQEPDSNFVDVITSKES